MAETTEDIQIEKGFAATAETPGEKVAHRISVVANPLFVALPLFLVVALHTAPDLLHALGWWLIIAVGITGAPFFFIRMGVKRGKYTDDHVSNRAQRFVPLSFGLICMLLVFVLLFFLAVPRLLLATVVAALATLAFAIVITQFGKFKISLHMAGSAGAVTICILLFGPWLFVLAPLVILIGWARWKVRAHTVLQACAGTVLAALVTIAVLWLFGVL
ncbi:hypothetical protein KDA_76100 [Dictyobacter alpinus]|uniref:Phosphatidic acid phosphatase type 2/haloperoxidase domain-containing protein n=1 Tax=Dictyobacter alpinus TaxID=2014873 RepID=A0A402BLC1_9CHLR|nr:hypothetical protein [Dictyobacter alpinus]GCE32126.1 hypothetical protein KDA_76100 [Dictyobacter alpinus]